MTPKQLGILGERIAADYLKKKGYEILGKNYSPHYISGPKRGEIDIISRKNNTIHFVEVKTLAKSDRGRVSAISPEIKVDFQKQRKLTKTAESWLMKKKTSLNSKWQIDVISIKINLENKKAKIRHFKNIASE